MTMSMKTLPVLCWILASVPGVAAAQGSPPHGATGPDTLPTVRAESPTPPVAAPLALPHAPHLPAAALPLADVGSLSDQARLSALEALSALGDLSALRDLHALGALPALAELSALGELGQLGLFGELGQLGQLGVLGEFASAAAFDEPFVIDGIGIYHRSGWGPTAAKAVRAAPTPIRARIPAEPWASQDPADSLYRAARAALNQGDHARAADLFRQITIRFPKSAYAGDALYWQAFARYRIGGAEELRLALAALEQQRTGYPNASTAPDAAQLATRIRGELARAGDAEAAEVVTKEASRAATTCSAEDAEVRAAALNALLRMDSERAVPVLDQVLARRDACSAPLRKRAVFLVAQNVTPQTEEILLKTVREDPDLEVRRAAVFYLSQVSTDRAVSALEELLRTGTDASIQERALFALSQHASPRASQVLRAYAERAGAPRELRAKAIYWIGQTGAADRSTYLRALYRKLDDLELKERVLFALAQASVAGDEKWLLDLALDTTETVALRKKALFWASQAGAPIQELVGLYERARDREMKEQLIFVYSQRGEKAAVDKLIDIARRESDVALRRKAIFWLSESDDPRAAQVLLEILGNG
jgi:HEAT repeat protein